LAMDEEPTATGSFSKRRVRFGAPSLKTDNSAR
jgi:hypothetical protein